MNLLLWIYAKLSQVVDFFTQDLVTGKSWAKNVPPPLRSGGASAPEVTPEAPYPGPHKVDPVTPDRPHASYEDRLGLALAEVRYRLRMERMEMERRWREAVEDEIEEMVPLVREGDTRG